MGKQREAEPPVAAEGHPAALAWQALGPERRAPSAVERVMGKKPQARRRVYRLLHATDEGGPVIAKRYQGVVHDVERLFYQDVLPDLAVRTPRYFGELEAEPGYAWIFLEDVGRERFSPADAGQRALAARWLGTMHAVAPELPRIDLLPDRGPRYYRRHLDAGRRLILDNLGNPALTPDGVELLRSVVARHDQVERRWPELEDICAAAPQTLVHGDFRPKNVFVQDARILVIDWELAGWGAPAADLAPRRHRTGNRYTPQVDLRVYCPIMRERWPDFDARRARQLMWVGLIFRRLAAIEWAALSLVYPRPEVLSMPLSQLRFYGEQLHQGLEEYGSA